LLSEVACADGQVESHLRLLARIETELLESRLEAMRFRIVALEQNYANSVQYAYSYENLLANNQIVNKYGLTVAAYQKLKKTYYDAYLLWLKSSVEGMAISELKKQKEALSVQIKSLL
jgi:hypothetical protein